MTLKTSCVIGRHREFLYWQFSSHKVRLRDAIICRRRAYNILRARRVTGSAKRANYEVSSQRCSFTAMIRRRHGKKMTHVIDIRPRFSPHASTYLPIVGSADTSAFWPAATATRLPRLFMTPRDAFPCSCLAASHFIWRSRYATRCFVE